MAEITSEERKSLKDILLQKKKVQKRIPWLKDLPQPIAQENANGLESCPGINLFK